MPHYNIWIREEDDKNWLAIDNRSEWLHERLNTIFATPIITTNTNAERIVESVIDSPRFKSPKLCKHGSIKGECFSKEAPRLKCNVLGGKV